MKILVTGSAGFIGFHLTNALLQQGYDVIGLDNINAYYDVDVKFGRLSETGIKRTSIEEGRLIKSEIYERYQFIKLDLTDAVRLNQLFQEQKFDAVCHLAAQAGVRYSLTNPQAYIDSNIQGFLNILEGCRNLKIKHLVYASSSSVYGLNKKMPFSSRDNVDHPISLYAASKKSNELMAHTYSHLFNIPTTGLRFFTVYGPWGRPDMAIYLFTKAILEGRPVKIFNNGKMKRDFTFVDDIVEGIMRVLNKPPLADHMWRSDDPNSESSSSPYRILNIGRGKPVSLMTFVEEIERSVGQVAQKEFLPMQDGDVEETWANIDMLINEYDYEPKVEVAEGISKFVKWYKDFYKVNG